MKKQKFERTVFTRSTKSDEVRERVQIRIIAVDSHGRFIKGTLGKTITIRNARVSDVHNAIEQTLFGD